MHVTGGFLPVRGWPLRGGAVMGSPQRSSRLEPSWFKRSCAATRRPDESECDGRVADRPELDHAPRAEDAQRVEGDLDRPHDADRVGALLDLEPFASR